MSSRRIREVLVIALAAVTAALPVAAETALPQPVEYFYEEIRSPLSIVREMVDVARDCEQQFGTGCQLPAGAAGDSLQRVAKLLDALVYAPRPGLMRGFDTADDARGFASELRTRFLADLRQREMRLIAKAIAVAQDCPSEVAAPELIANLRSMTAINFSQFWGMNDQDYRALELARWRLTWDERGDIQKHWTSERCLAASRSALHVLRQFYTKVAPFEHMREGGLSERERLGAAAAFTWELAYQLDAEADPGVRQRVEAIGRSP